MLKDVQKDLVEAQRVDQLVAVGLKALIVLAELRMAARLNKNWVFADKIRDLLKVADVDVMDTENGYILRLSNGRRVLEVDGEKVSL